MFLDDSIKSQPKQYLKLMEGDVALKVSLSTDVASLELDALVKELAALSDKISIEYGALPRTPSFTISRPDEQTGITFAGAPLGHEFSSLVLALLQTSGRPPKAEPEIIDKIRSLKGEYRFETFVSLSCHNCPDVVQALNLMSILNPNISNVTINGAVFTEEAEKRKVMAVPSVFLNGEFFESGRMDLEEIVSKLGASKDASYFAEKAPYDVLIVGGGPAGASAAIYAARKSLRTGIVAERFGGQVKETLGIENFISVSYTEGPKLVASLEEHVKAYDIDLMTAQKAKSLKKGELIEVELENGAVLKSKTVIVSTGARWRGLNVPGEKEFKNKGIAYCPHCDGPVFKGKNVAVIGGGNSGVEAAIDLACIANHVTLLEFLPDLKADAVLQKRLYSLSNVTVLKNVQTTQITGDDKVNGLTYMERDTKIIKHLDLQGVFILIGLVPNTEWLKDAVNKNWMGEIVVDKHGATSLPGVFAAGDCADSAYKQIIISMGSGATAALGAFDYLIRNYL
jgi:alkyl hydroperoxide reductase subunit F